MAELKKSLGTLRLTFYGVGTIVGAGIYTVIGAAAGQAGYDLWLSFILAAVAASFSAVSYAELSSTFPNAGAEFIFLKKAFPKIHIPSFLTGWTIAFHSSATIAAVLLAFSGYLNVFFQFPSLLISYGALILLALISITGIKKSSTANIFMVSIQLLGLLILIVVGLTSTGAPEKEFFQIESFENTLAATATLFFIYTGFEHMAALGSEVKNPGKTIPRAFLLTMLITTIIYLFISFTVLNISNPSKLANEDSPLSVAASNLNSWLPVVLAVAALFATANAAFSGIISISRLLFGMAKTGELPTFIEKTNKQKVPWAATLIVLVAVGAFLLLGDIKTVAGMSSLGALLVFIAVNIALIVLRYKAPEQERPFKVPLSLGKLPVLPILAILISASLTIQYQWQVYAAFGGAIVVGVVLHYFLDRKPKKELKPEEEKELFGH
ncbi:amino acid permease [Salinimicrobium sp. CDJ15-81-2]|jgi:APA family basic amino acid/polyamine antiporter|uniref:Amino acid permease n=3 Tax=Flavobacteriaceae TaxID=49546 RepID=A0A9X3I0V9_9FLAO|nr:MULTISPECIES: amino acid permease [Flavobacteriaceae]MDX1601851.1 amino acid permease [Salinimicrobium sediminis]NJY63503.1 amino acid permease [Salinimicrobium nanhaiense]MCX2838430.1 amino acid permease [Salinimicrobium profundisediminis]MDT0647093.1 amino acid permease [Zunongwangia sp. F260]NJW52172.1 amino acid permease [Salinimicrobium oceani]